MLFELESSPSVSLQSKIFQQDNQFETLVMSSTMNLSPCIKPPLHQLSRPISFNQNPFSLKFPNLHEFNSVKFDLIKRKAVASFSEEAASVGRSSFDNSPISVQLDPILSEEQFDRVVDEAKQIQRAVVIVWVANWCRKCIYLKPKLEKLAAEYHPSVRFYSVDVNNVSHKLVARAEVTKMPTIQVWIDGKKKGEVIGGHKAYLVVNEVREMIENESSSL